MINRCPKSGTDTEVALITRHALLVVFDESNMQYNCSDDDQARESIIIKRDNKKAREIVDVPQSPANLK